MSRFAAFFVACLALVAAAFVAPRTLALALDRFGVDKRQDAQIEELETQIRELRATLAVPEPKPSPYDDDNAIRGIDVARSPSIGPRDAWVTIVAFLDYQCPFCNRAQATLERILEENPDVRLVVKHQPLPFHKDAFDGALTAECAHRQDQFWPVHRTLFANQRELSTVARHLPANLDLEVLESCKASAEARAVVEEDVRVANRVGARGTPTFFINGRKLTGAQPYERFVDAIERARREAKASGIPAARYYVDGVIARATVF